MTTYTITTEQLAAVRTQRKQLLDSPHKNDHAAAALLNWAETLQPAAACATPSSAAHAGNAKTLARDHQGMRVAYSGLLGQCRRALREGGHSALAEMLRQLQGHLQELGRRWYAGDVAVVDELLQLYCVEPAARAALKATHSSGPEPVALTNEVMALVPDNIPGSEWHLTALMAPFGLTYVVGQDRQHLLSFGRAVWCAALAASQPAPAGTRELVGWTWVEGGVRQFTASREMAQALTATGLRDPLPLYTDSIPVATVEAQAVPEGSDVVPYDVWRERVECARVADAFAHESGPGLDRYAGNVISARILARTRGRVAAAPNPAPTPAKGDANA